MGKLESKQRIEFIVKTIRERGHIRRRDIMNEFGVSIVTASNDLRQTQALNQSLMTYDYQQRLYIRKEGGPEGPPKNVDDDAD